MHLVFHTLKPIASAALIRPDSADTALFARLLDQYPPAIPGVHRLIYPDERLTIDLWYGDVVAEDPPAPTIRIVAEVNARFAVIGAGIAGLSITQALTQRGYPVTLIDASGPVTGASGNPRALLLSKLPKLHLVSRNLQTLGALTTARWWQDWTSNVITAKGALVAIDDEDLEKIQGYTPDMVEIYAPDQIKASSGLSTQNDYLYLPKASVLNPRKLATHVQDSPCVHSVQGTVARMIREEDNLWHLYNDQGHLITTATHVMVATARNSNALCPSIPAQKVIRGQMSWCAVSDLLPRLAVGYGGYAVHFEGQILLGSTFVRDDHDTSLRPEEHQHNWSLLHQAFPALAAQLPPTPDWHGRAGLRALPRDSMPLIGAVPEMPQVYSLTGMGSKGFSYAPLCAELLAGQILHEALPMTDAFAASVDVQRFQKKIRARKPYYSGPYAKR